MSSEAGSSDHDAKRRKISQSITLRKTTKETKNLNEEDKDGANVTYHYEENVRHYEETFVRENVGYRHSKNVSSIEQTNSSWYDAYRARVVKNLGDANRNYGTSEYDVHILEKRGKRRPSAFWTAEVYYYSNVEKT